MDQILIFDNHKEANKTMKHLIDILKVFSDAHMNDDVMVDVARSQISGIYNNSFVVVDGDTVSKIFRGMDSLVSDADDKVYKINANDVHEMKCFLEATKKNFDKVFLQKIMGGFELVVVIFNKVDELLYTQKLEFKISNGDRRLSEIRESIRNGPTARRSIDLSMGDVASIHSGVPLHIRGGDSVICRIMNNTLVRKMKCMEYPAILDYIVNEDSGHACCVLSYGAGTSKMDEMHIHQYFKTIVF
ncbi:MAG: hypothetical protein ACRC0G_07100 [Fusobacteriaceae bacterium]